MIGILVFDFEGDSDGVFIIVKGFYVVCMDDFFYIIYEGMGVFFVFVYVEFV